MKTRMIKNFKQSLKNKLIKPKQCKYCHPNEIIQNLFIGNINNVKNTELMNKIGITHFLFIAHNDDNIDHNINKSNHKIITVTNNGHIIRYFDESFVFIDSVLNDNNNNNNNNKIIIFCQFGISLSPSFIIAYLIKKYNLSLMTSLNIIKTKRNIINTEIYNKQLKIFENINFNHNKNNHKNRNQIKKWQFLSRNKINIINQNNDNKGNGNKENEFLIQKRIITMKSNVYQEKLLTNDHDNNNHNKYTYDNYNNYNSKKIQRSYSSDYVPLNSHIVFTNI